MSGDPLPRTAADRTLDDTTSLVRSIDYEIFGTNACNGACTSVKFK